MHILFVLAGGTPGGGTTYVIQLLRTLALDKAYQLTFVVDPNSYAEKEAKAMGIHTYPIALQETRFSIKNVRKLNHIFATINPDIIHAHGCRAGFYCARAKAERNAHFFYTVHGYHFISKKTPLRQLTMLAEIFIAKHADVIINVGYDEYELSKCYNLVPINKQHHIVPNGIFLHESPILELERFKRRHIVYMGRLSPEKRPEFCLKVFQLLEHHNFHMTFIGGGVLEESIISTINANGWNERVICTGILSHQEALAKLRQASVLLMPSKAEGLPLAPLEAYASGLPVVASHVHGLKEVVHNGVTGYTIPKLDPETYAQAISYLHNNPSTYENFVRAGQAMLSTYSFEKSVSKHLELYTAWKGKK